MLASLIFGLIAWTLPVINLLKYENPTKSWIIFSLLSLMACSIALLSQLLSFHDWIKAGDWTALMDTSGAVITASAILLIGTIILNTITVYLYRNK